MDKNSSISNLYGLVNVNWPLVQKNYNQQFGSTSIQRDNFAVRHVNLHLTKITGEIATVVEECEHSGNFDRESLLQTPRQLITGALKLACVLGVTPDEIAKGMDEWVEKYKKES